MAYDDLRVLPNSKITRDLMEASSDTISNGEGRVRLHHSEI